MIYLLVFILMLTGANAEERFYYCDDEIPDCWCFPKTGEDECEIKYYQAVDTCAIQFVPQNTNCTACELGTYSSSKHGSWAKDQFFFGAERNVGKYEVGTEIFNETEDSILTTSDIKEEYFMIRDYLDSMREAHVDFHFDKGDPSDKFKHLHFECFVFSKLVAKQYETKFWLDEEKTRYYKLRIGYVGAFQRETPVGIDNKFRKLKVFYEDGLLYINSEKFLIDVEIYNTKGIKLFTKINHSPFDVIEINLPSGAYFVKAGNQTYKLLINN